MSDLAFDSMMPSSASLYGGGDDMTPSSVPLYGGGDGMTHHQCHCMEEVMV